MGIRNFPVVTIADLEGKFVSPADATPAATTIPTMQSGVAPKFVHIAVQLGTPFDYVVITPSYGGNGDATLGLPLVTGNDGINLNVQGFSHIGYEAVGAGMRLYIYPLEDF